MQTTHSSVCMLGRHDNNDDEDDDEDDDEEDEDEDEDDDDDEEEEEEEEEEEDSHCVQISRNRSVKLGNDLIPGQKTNV